MIKNRPDFYDIGMIGILVIFAAMSIYVFGYCDLCQMPY
jgi:hypothetical protein